MLKYIKTGGLSDTKRSEYLLRGWMKLVAPLTPSTVDDIPRLRCVQDAIEDGYPYSISLLLAGIATSQCCTAQLCASTIPLVSKAWPTMWIWIQYVYTVHRSAKHLVNQKAYLAQLHEIFVKLLRMFSEHDTEPTVAKILSSHPGILPMMIDMWIREATDKSAVLGFRCAEFGNFQNDSTEEPFLVQLIIACGTAEEAVHIACLRVERHLGQAQREYDILSKDLSFFAQHLCRPTDSPLAPAMYASSGVATAIMHAWGHITSDSCKTSPENRDGWLYFCLLSTLWLLQQSPQAYDRILDCLYHDLLPVLAKSFGMIRSSSNVPSSTIIHERFTAHAISMLREILAPATVHRKVISSTRPWIAANQARGNLELPGLKGNPGLTEAWLEFTTTLGDRGRLYGMFKESTGTVILCGNANVRTSK